MNCWIDISPDQVTSLVGFSERLFRGTFVEITMS
jgi:hypothetical protein